MIGTVVYASAAVEGTMTSATRYTTHGNPAVSNCANAATTAASRPPQHPAPSRPPAHRSTERSAARPSGCCSTRGVMPLRPRPWWERWMGRGHTTQDQCDTCKL